MLLSVFAVVAVAVVSVVALFGDPWAQRAVKRIAERRERKRREAESRNFQAKDPDYILVREIHAKVDRELNAQPKMTLWYALKIGWKTFKGEQVGTLKE